MVKYKTVTLRVGFDPSRDGYLNPCMDVIQDNIHYKPDDDKKYLCAVHPKNFVRNSQIIQRNCVIAAAKKNT